MKTLLLFLILAAQSVPIDQRRQVLEEGRLEAKARALEASRCMYGAVLKATDMQTLGADGASAEARFYLNHVLRPVSHLITIHGDETRAGGKIYALSQLWGYADRSKNLANENNGVYCELIGFVAYKATPLVRSDINWSQLVNKLEAVSVNRLPAGYHNAAGVIDGVSLVIEQYGETGRSLSVFHNPDMQSGPPAETAASVVALLDKILAVESKPPDN